MHELPNLVSHARTKRKRRPACPRLPHGGDRRNGDHETQPFHQAGRNKEVECIADCPVCYRDRLDSLSYLTKEGRVCLTSLVPLSGTSRFIGFSPSELC